MRSISPAAGEIIALALTDACCSHVILVAMAASNSHAHTAMHHGV
jgi:hypothetical protein